MEFLKRISEHFVDPKKNTNLAIPDYLVFIFDTLINSLEKFYLEISQQQSKTNDIDYLYLESLLSLIQANNFAFIK